MNILGLMAYSKRGMLLILGLVLVASLTPLKGLAQQVNLNDILRGSGSFPNASQPGRAPNPGAVAEQQAGSAGAARGLGGMPPRQSVCRFAPLDEKGQQLDAAARVVDVHDNTFYYPNAFERYVKDVTGQELCRFGHQLGSDLSSFFEPPPLSMVPDDYVLGPGDEVYVRLWGSVEQDIALVIDRSGQIVIPRVGPVKLAGVRYSEASNVIRAQVRKLFTDFNASVSLGQLRGIRVFITGYA
jgi:hypothetical protein